MKLIDAVQATGLVLLLVAFGLEAGAIWTHGELRTQAGSDRGAGG